MKLATNSRTSARRSFLQAGFLALGGLGVSDLLRGAEEAAARIASTEDAGLNATISFDGDVVIGAGAWSVIFAAVALTRAIFFG